MSKAKSNSKSSIKNYGKAIQKRAKELKNKKDISHREAVKQAAKELRNEGFFK